jgi:hypothetical protein
MSPDYIHISLFCGLLTVAAISVLWLRGRHIQTKPIKKMEKPEPKYKVGDEVFFSYPAGFAVGTISEAFRAESLTCADNWAIYYAMEGIEEKYLESGLFESMSDLKKEWDRRFAEDFPEHAPYIQEVVRSAVDGQFRTKEEGDINPEYTVTEKIKRDR